MVSFYLLYAVVKSKAENFTGSFIHVFSDYFLYVKILKSSLAHSQKRHILCFLLLFLSPKKFMAEYILKTFFRC